VRRGKFDPLRLEALIVWWHLLRLGEPGGQRLEEADRGQAAHRERGGALQKAPPVDHVVNVLVEELQDFGREVASLAEGFVVGHVGSLQGRSFRSQPPSRVEITIAQV
jgi:hypothetical protein